MALAKVIVRARRIECDSKGARPCGSSGTEEEACLCAATNTADNIVTIGIIPPPEDSLASENLEIAWGGIKSPADNVVWRNVVVDNHRINHIDDSTHPGVQLIKVLVAPRVVKADRVFATEGGVARAEEAIGEPLTAADNV